MWSILKKFPSSSVNNSREIIREKLKRMLKYPSEINAQQLENLGIDTDFSVRDYGEPPYEDNN